MARPAFAWCLRSRLGSAYCVWWRRWCSSCPPHQPLAAGLDVLLHARQGAPHVVALGVGAFKPCDLLGESQVLPALRTLALALFVALAVFRDVARQRQLVDRLEL